MVQISSGMCVLTRERDLFVLLFMKANEDRYLRMMVDVVMEMGATCAIAVTKL